MIIGPARYECDQCSSEFDMFVLWDWVYAQAAGVDPNMVWKFVALVYKPGITGNCEEDYSHGVFMADNMVAGTLCESCVEENIGRKLCWWDYMHIAGNFPGVDLDFFLP
jgi:hypothetical protein